MAKDCYFTYVNGKFDCIHLRELAKQLALPAETRISAYSNNPGTVKVWSARLSSGLFGLTSCESGNRGPKDYNEVILSVGNEGLKKLVELNFIPCPSCHPEKIDGFWDVVKCLVKNKYGINTLEDYVNKKFLTFDARRIKWEEILPMIGKAPNRIYVPRCLSNNDLLVFKKRFTDLGFSLPSVGYYNADAPERFTEYKILSS
jgi:hypothetical protein